jgi:lipid II:glycine glycyltransferase (peptidoglycan interpeptide bridge formation enzyme)
VSINLEFAIEIVDNAKEWNLLLDNLLTSDTYIKWSWGEYKKRCGWNIKHLKLVDTHSKKIIACCQLQTKRKGIISINLLQGGIHISKDNNINDVYDCAHRTVQSYINNNNWIWLLLINYQSHNLDEADTSLMKLGFAPLLTNKMFTKLIFNENNNLDISSLSKNWRHNLKRANNNELMKIEWVNSYEDRVMAFNRLFEMYDILKRRKNFATGIDLVKASDSMILDQSMIIVQAKLDGEVVAIRVGSVCNDHLLDLIAASNEGAVKCYANYLLMWNMIMKMKELNKDYFDTGGIDPASNMGVFNFKKGLKGRLITNGPLWILGSNKLVVWIIRKIFI